MVECDLAKVDVVGSNPIRRSIRLRIQRLDDRMLRRMSLAVAFSLLSVECEGGPIIRFY